MIDFHAHIIPDFDDGAKNAQRAVDMLRVLFSQGVKKVVATPHFYAGQQSVKEYCEQRAEKLWLLRAAMAETGEEFPKIAVGCEVLYFPTIYSFEEISSLCIEGTDFLVLEMPEKKWTQSIFDSVHRLISNCAIVPVIAHIDRYLPYGNGVKELEKLKELGACIQLNTDFFDGFLNRRRALSLVKKSLIDVLGTDCHNMSDRRPEMETALFTLKENLGTKSIKKIEDTSEKILKNAVFY